MAKEPERAWARLRALYRFDSSFADGMLIAGCDEAGRGALAGPACVACVHLPVAAGLVSAATGLPSALLSLCGVDDSKRLSPKKREDLFPKIIALAEIGIGWATPAEIDRIGIVPALRNAARRAYLALGVDADLVLLDRGLTLGRGDTETQAFSVSFPLRVSSPSFPRELAFTRGDAKSLHIAAASIIAKVSRDRLMVELDRRVPGTGSRNTRDTAPRPTAPPSPAAVHPRSTAAASSSVLCRTAETRRTQRS